jgi:hypothetical protein
MRLPSAIIADELEVRCVRWRLRDPLRLHMIPKRYVYVANLPLNDRGKADRYACAQLSAS